MTWTKEIERDGFGRCKICNKEKNLYLYKGEYEEYRVCWNCIEEASLDDWEIGYELQREKMCMC